MGRPHGVGECLLGDVDRIGSAGEVVETGAREWTSGVLSSHGRTHGVAPGAQGDAPVGHDGEALAMRSKIGVAGVLALEGRQGALTHSHAERPSWASSPRPA